MKEIWKREDGWIVEVDIEPKTMYCKASHVPLIADPRPEPLTYEYLSMALTANGYIRI